MGFLQAFVLANNMQIYLYVKEIFWFFA